MAQQLLGTWVKDADKFVFDFVSDELDGKNFDADGSLRTRHNRTLTLAQAIHENAVSRIYLGVHWRMDAVEGTRLGREIVTLYATEKKGPAAVLPSPSTSGTAAALASATAAKPAAGKPAKK